MSSMLLTLAVGAGATLLVVVPVVLAIRREDAAWTRLAADLGLFRSDRVVHGSYDDLAVVVAPRSTANGSQVRLEVHDLHTGDLSLGPESLMTLLAPDPEVGDTDFDDQIHIEGPETQALAVLTGEARARLLAASHLHLRLEDGVLSGWYDRQGVPLDTSEVRRQLETLIGIARALHTEGPVDERLLANLRTERIPGVRLRIAQVLLSRGDARSEAVARELLRDPDPLLRLHALKLLPIDQYGAGRALDELLDHWEPRVRLAAIDHCRTHLDPEAGSARIGGRLEDRDLAVVQRALEACRSLDHRPLPQLLRMARGLLRPPPSPEALRTRPDPDLAAAAIALADLLGTASEEEAPEAEEALLSLLDWNLDTVRLAVVDALGAVGSVRAVPQLTPLTSGVLPGRLATVAGQAIAAIQDRIGPDAAGGLALSTTAAEAGGLTVSTTDEVAGGLSVPSGEPEP